MTNEEIPMSEDELEALEDAEDLANAPSPQIRVSLHKP